MTAKAWTPEMEERATQLLANSTARPWHVNGPFGPSDTMQSVGTRDGCVREGRILVGGTAEEACRDAALIAEGPELLESAMAEIDVLRQTYAAEIERLRASEKELIGHRAEAIRQLRAAEAKVQKLDLDLAEMAMATRPGPPAALQDEADAAAGRRRARRRK